MGFALLLPEVPSGNAETLDGDVLATSADQVNATITSNFSSTILQDQPATKTEGEILPLNLSSSTTPSNNQDTVVMAEVTSTGGGSATRPAAAGGDRKNFTANGGDVLPPILVKHFSVVPTRTNERNYNVYVNSNITNEAIEDLMNKLPGVSGASNTQIYIIAVVGILPAAGALAWCVRWMVAKRKKKGNPTTEEDYSSSSVPDSSNANSVYATAYVKAADGLPGPKLVYTTKRSNSFKDMVPYEEASKYYLKSWQAQNAMTHRSLPALPAPVGIHQTIQSKHSLGPWEFPRSHLLLTEIIGEGNFGQVWKAEARHLNGVPGVVIVAVKTVKGNVSQRERLELLKESQIMQKLGRHPNVVTLLGCCTLQEPFYLLMEYVVRGKLLSFLRSHRTNRNYYNCHPTSHSLTSRDLTLFAYQVALGMEYVASKGIIHRDLAARNILVDHNQVCKVADFGLARCIKEKQNEVYEQKSKGALPIRWMAPESLYLNVFTVKSDVWAFGVLLWEIITLGSTPYPGMGPREVVHHVQEGKVMERPYHCRPELYRVIRSCWAADPNQRPNFVGLKKDLARLLELQTGYIDLEHFPENCYYNLYQSPGERV